MKALFCESTSDIQLLLDRKEVIKMKRTVDCTPVLEAKDKGFSFSLMNSKSEEYIRVHEPRNPVAYPSYTVVINDDAYKDLVRDDKCGTRYNEFSKVNIIIE